MTPTRFAILLAVTAAVSLAAAVAYVDRRAGLAGVILEETLFPDLRARLNAVEVIAIQSPDESVTLARGADGWVLPEKHGYPVLGSLPRPFLLGIADLTLREAKTADPARHHRLDLRDPDIAGSRATRVTLRTADGGVLADVLVGSGRPGPADQAPYHYVRLPGDDQTWLAQGDFRIRPTVSEWIDRSILNIPRDDVVSVRVSPPDGPGYTAVRATEDTGGGFTLLDLGAGETVVEPARLGALFATLSRLVHDDVRPDDPSLAPVATARFALTDDRVVTLDLVDPGDGMLWGRINQDAPAVGDAVENPATEGWLYDLGQATVDRLTATRDSLLR